MHGFEEGVVRVGCGDELWCDADSQSRWKESVDWALRKGEREKEEDLEKEEKNKVSPPVREGRT
jgi:hypothetical protein